MTAPHETRKPVLRSEETALPAWATTLARLMDDAVRVPGTNIRFGLDAIVGLFAPGAGDAVSTASGVILLFVAFRARVPGIVIARMTMNSIVDALLGAVPLLGDIFDVAWKANRKNLRLIERFQRPGATARPADYAVVAISLIAILGALAVPLVVLGMLLRAVAR